MNTDKPKRGRRSNKEILAANQAIQSQNQSLVINEIQPNLVNELVNELANDLTQELESVPPLEQTLEKQLEQSLEKQLEQSLEQSLELAQVEESSPTEHVAKKRGRKPKGGKIIQQNILNNSQKDDKQNIILHLKCSLKDIENDDYNNNIESFNFNLSKTELCYQIIDSPPTQQNEDENKDNIQHECKDEIQHANQDDIKEKDIWRKLKVLEHNLHVNNISDKKSACFWCSYEFDNNPIYIPKHFIKGSYSVYGCFCSPECAVAHLMEENIDSSTKFERYYLMNHIYSKIYNYTRNIKPAPNPYYMLNKFYGNLTIQEYRSLLKSERLFLIVDKPLTRVLPEFHEDNDEFIINNKIIPSNYNAKKLGSQQNKSQTKNNIVNEHFGLGSVY
jgi:hypothetical protein